MGIFQDSTKKACAHAAKLVLKDLKQNHPALMENRWVLLFLALLGSFVCGELCDITWLHRGIPDTDSSVFRYIGYAMANGKIPYVDLFDHKGPLLFLINYVGYCIRRHVGMWVIQFGMFFLLICSLFKTAKLICQGNLRACAATALSLSLLTPYFCGGNYTESYSMPFIAAALYIFTEYFTSGVTPPRWKILVCGFCGGCVLMLRPNLAAAWLVFPVCVIVRELLRKNAKALWNYILFFVLGVGLATVPFAVYYAWVGGLEEFYEAYILFNLAYTASDNSFSATVSAIWYFASPLVLLSILMLLFQLFQKKNTMLSAAWLAFLLLSLVCVGMGGRLLDHYGMPLIPALIYPMALLMGMYEKKPFHRTAMAVLLAAVFLAGWLPMLSNAINHVRFGPSEQRDQRLSQVVDFVKENTQSDDPIIVTGNRHQVYFYSERLSASRHSYQIPTTDYYPKFREEFYRDLEETPPALVVINHLHRLPLGFEDWLESHHYVQVFANETYDAWLPEDKAAQVLVNSSVQEP